DEDVEPPEAVADRGEESPHALRIADVHGEPGRRPADLGRDPLRRRSVQVGQRDPGALGGEPAGDRLADAPGGTGDDRHLALQTSYATAPWSIAYDSSSSDGMSVTVAAWHQGLRTQM